MATLNTYLNFPGNCEEAFEFYRSLIGGEFAMVMRFGDVPGDGAGMPIPAGEERKLMHISYPIGQGTILMGSDRLSSMGPGTRGDNHSLSLNVGSDEEAQRIFDGLAAGGQITMPIGKTFWGSFFGMLVDKYGVQWMVAHDPGVAS